VGFAGLRARFTLDARSLALGRVLLALVVLADLVVRAGDLRAHYTDDGVLPRSAFRLSHFGFAWSLHLLGGSATFEAVLFGLMAVAALALLVGYRTFWATLACWLLTISMCARNPLLRDGQETMTRVLLFWCLFLPVGQRASLDRLRGRRPHPFLPTSGDQVFSAGTVGLIAQLIIIYLVAACAKIESEWWRAGDGLARALSLGRYETRLGQLALGHPGLLAFMDYATIVVELALPLLFLASVRLRKTVLAGFALLHLGFVPFLRLGLFPLASIAGWSLAMPKEFWTRWPKREVASADPPAVGKISLGLVALALGLVTTTNLRDLGVPVPFPNGLEVAAAAVGLNQWWCVFAPPSRRSSPDDGWWVYVGDLENGDRVDLTRSQPQPPRWVRPPLIADTFKSRRWRQYMANFTLFVDGLPFRETSLARRAYALYLCRSWRGPPLKHAAIYFVHHRPLEPADPPHVMKVAEGDCRATEVATPTQREQPVLQ
jgi:hypothetical protein